LKAGRLTLFRPGDGQAAARQSFDSDYTLRIRFNPPPASMLLEQICFRAPAVLKVA
jgi:hypothetical protein